MSRYVVGAAAAALLAGWPALASGEGKTPDPTVPFYVEAPARDAPGGAERFLLAGGTISGVGPTAASGSAPIVWTAAGLEGNVDVWTRALPAGAWALLGTFAASAGTTSPTTCAFGSAGLRTEIWVGAAGGQVVGSAINVAPGSPSIRSVGPATAAGTSAITWTAQGISGNVEVWVRTLPNGAWTSIGSFPAGSGTTGGATHGFGPGATRTEIWVGGNGGSVVGRNVNLAPAATGTVASGGLLGGGVLVGLTIDPATRDLYAALTPGLACTAAPLTIVRVSPGGAQSSVGTYGFSTCLQAQMAWGPDGRIYVNDHSSRNVFSIDPGTGAATLYSATGFGFGLHSLDFDPSGNLILIQEAVPNQVFQVNPGSGLTFLGGYVTSTSQHGDGGGIQPDGDIVIYPDCGSPGSVFELDADGHVAGTDYPLRDITATDVVSPGCGFSIGAIDKQNGDVFTSIVYGQPNIYYTPGEIGPAATSGPLVTPNVNVTALVVGPSSSGPANRSLYYVRTGAPAIHEVPITAVPSLFAAGPTTGAGSSPITWSSTGLTSVDVWVRPLPGGTWLNLGAFPAGPGSTSPVSYDFGSAGQKTEIWLGGTGPGGAANATAINTVPGTPTITAGAPPAGGAQPITWTSSGVTGNVEVWARPWPAGAWVQVGAFPVADGTTGASTYDFGGSGTRTEIWVGGSGGQVVGSLIFNAP